MIESVVLVVGSIVSIICLFKYMAEFYGKHMTERLLKEQGIDESGIKEAMDFLVNNLGPKKIREDKEKDKDNKTRGMFQ